MIVSKNAGIFAALISVAFLWGTSFAVSKVALQTLSPLNLAGLRFALAALLFAAIVCSRKQWLRRQDIGQFLLLGFLAITSYFYIQYTGLLYTTSINAALLLATSPVVTLLCSSALGREKLTANALLGVGLAFFGVCLVISRGQLFTLFAAETLLGDAMMLLNALVWAGFTLYGQNLMTRYSPFTAISYITIFGSLLLLPVVLIANPLNPVSLLSQLPHITTATMGAILYLALLCSVYAYSVWYYAIERIGAVRTASFSYVSPLFALLAGVCLLDETVSVLALVGGITVLGGVYLTNHSRTK